MTLSGEGRLLRIFIGESDTYHHKPLYHEIVTAARREGMAELLFYAESRVTGRHSMIHTTRILALSQSLPLVVEIVDSTDKIDTFLPKIEPMVTEGLITLEPVEIHLYRARQRTHE